MPNMQNLPEQVQPMSGDASIEAALAAMTPEQAQTFMAGGFGQTPVAQGSGVSPALQQSLVSLGNLNEEEKIILAQKLSDIINMTQEASNAYGADYASAALADQLGYSLPELPASNMQRNNNWSGGDLTTEDALKIKMLLEEINNIAKGNAGPQISEVLASYGGGIGNE